MKFIDGMVNSTEVVVHFKTNFVKVVQNQLLFRKTIDAVRQLILQDFHVTYCEIETTLGINGIQHNSILHEHLTVKKICLRWMAHNLSIAQKNQSIRVTKMLGQCFKLMQKCLDLTGVYFEKQ